MKYILFKAGAACLALFSCSSVENGNTKESLPDAELPFIGRKQFETRPAVSGTGTPHKYLEIMTNGDVLFGYEQENQGDGTISKEIVNAGKFSKYMKCFFEEANETFYYEITKNTIYEVDSNNLRTTGEECCSSENISLESKCPCESAYF